MSKMVITAATKVEVAKGRIIQTQSFLLFLEAFCWVAGKNWGARSVVRKLAWSY
jgi:hypothetical protein